MLTTLDPELGAGRVVAHADRLAHLLRLLVKLFDCAFPLFPLLIAALAAAHTARALASLRTLHDEGRLLVAAAGLRLVRRRLRHELGLLELGGWSYLSTHSTF